MDNIYLNSYLVTIHQQSILDEALTDIFKVKVDTLKNFVSDLSDALENENVREIVKILNKVPVKIDEERLTSYAESKVKEFKKEEEKAEKLYDKEVEKQSNKPGIKDEVIQKLKDEKVKKIITGLVAILAVFASISVPCVTATSALEGTSEPPVVSSLTTSDFLTIVEKSNFLLCLTPRTSSCESSNTPKSPSTGTLGSKSSIFISAIFPLLIVPYDTQF